MPTAEKFKFYSLMEERAKLFQKKAKTSKVTLPVTPLEVEKELSNLSITLKSLSSQLREARDIVLEKERQFLLLANYKYSLEKTQITPTLVTFRTSREKDKYDLLLEELEGLTEEQKLKLKEIEL